MRAVFRERERERESLSVCMGVDRAAAIAKPSRVFQGICCHLEVALSLYMSAGM